MDDRNPPLRLVCSDELGQLKVVQTADGAQLGTAAVAATWGQPDKLQWIDCIALGSSSGICDTATAVLAVARCSGSIELLSPITGQPLGTLPSAPCSGSSNSSSGTQDAVRVRGLHLLWGSYAVDSLPAVLSVTQGGTARLHTPAAPAEGVHASWEQLRSWQVPAEVWCTAYEPASGRLAVGCQGAELRLFDVMTGELVFAFKGGKPNKVGLVDRPWNTTIAFLPPVSSGGGGGGNGIDSGSGSRRAGDRLLVGTGYHKLRLYDMEAGKRPQMELAWGEGRITCLAPEPSGRCCWVGNGLGQITALDLQARRFTGAVKGLAGAVRGLAVHPEVPVLASVGLDRYLCLHSTQSRKLLAKVYCKTLPTGLAMCPTDASMLLPLEQKEERQGRRKKKKVASENEKVDSEEEQEDEEEAPRQQQRQYKRSKQRNEGGGKRTKGTRQQQRQAVDSD